jgi:hypothetical protein
MERDTHWLWWVHTLSGRSLTHLGRLGTNYGSLLLVIDSLDAMVLDVGIRHALMFLQDAMEQLKHRHGEQSNAILHAVD